MVVIALTAVIVFVGYTRPNPFGNERTAHVMFRDAGGIGVVGADVRVDGARAGKITERKREGDHAVLTLQLDRDVGAIHRDARAELRPRTAFEGTAYVDLDPGSAASPALGDSVLPTSRTRVYVALDQALRFAGPSTRQATRADVHALHEIFAHGGTDGISHLLRISPALTRQAAVAGHAARGPGGQALRGAVDAFAATLHTVSGSREDLAAAVRDGGPTFAAINADGSRPLDRTLAILPARLADLQAGGTALQTVLARLDALSGDLGRGVRDLPATLRQTRPILRTARPVLADAPPLLDALRGGIHDVARSSAPTRRLLRSLSPVDELLTSSLLPALLKTTSLGAPAYLQFINLFQGGGGAFRPYQTAVQGNAPLQAGPGHFVRFSARFFTGAGYPLPPCSALEKVNASLAATFAKNDVCQ
ncbi:MlaD family protein [Paraconexibacter antarcticus]|uniref:MlaD family protein n=1 Tax=Paraconexibacter antarcticus TaxID=2949664 RepID=A0ABY5E190_9ACTN|nr:MlaD family protein [Paraconexibacter antarcticus]UTI66862.1 MlaD family protein [Paraconexibacter antarcticus]